MFQCYNYMICSPDPSPLGVFLKSPQEHNSIPNRRKQKTLMSISVLGQAVYGHLLG